MGVPITSIVIAFGLLLLSVAIVGGISPKVGRKTTWTCAVAGCLVLGAGLYLHLAASPASTPPPAATAVQPAKRPFSFTFAPERVRWGQEVKIAADQPIAGALVYLNDRPVPSRPAQDANHLNITIPSTSKSGYLAVQAGGQRVRAEQQLVVTGP
jgi:hypothetical protein